MLVRCLFDLKLPHSKRQLLDKKKYLEHHWALAKQQLDEERALHAKRRSESKKEYEEILEEEKTKFERTKKENEARLEDLKSAHVEQYDQLSREALRTNRELDRLRRELVGKGIDPQLGLSKTRKGGRVWLVFVFVFGILSVAVSFLLEFDYWSILVAFFFGNHNDCTSLPYIGMFGSLYFYLFNRCIYIKKTLLRVIF